MAEARREGLKQTLLMGFIALNVILILLVWADNLIEEPGGQGFVRSTSASPATMSVTTAGPQITPSHPPGASQAPGAPAATPVPNRDSGDIGMLQPLPDLYQAGS